MNITAVSHEARSRNIVNSHPPSRWIVYPGRRRKKTKPIPRKQKRKRKVHSTKKQQVNQGLQQIKARFMSYKINTLSTETVLRRHIDRTILCEHENCGFCVCVLPCKSFRISTSNRRKLSWRFDPMKDGKMSHNCWCILSYIYAK